MRRLNLRLDARCRMLRALVRARAALRVWCRWLNGDAAYANYLVHVRGAHPDLMPLTRAAFYRVEVERRWNGVRRCC